MPGPSYRSESGPTDFNTALRHSRRLPTGHIDCETSEQTDHPTLLCIHCGYQAMKSLLAFYIEL